MNHFFDVGANIGQTFDDYLVGNNKHDGWKIWCFEPSVRHFPQLIAKIDAVKSRYSVVLCPFGIGGENTTAEFFPKIDPRGDSFERYLYCNPPTPVVNLSAGYELVFPMVSLPEFILRHTAPNDVIELKLDCEGGEFTALPALLNYPEALRRISTFFVEFHHKGTGWDVEMNKIKADYSAAGKIIKDWFF